MKTTSAYKRGFPEPLRIFFLVCIIATVCLPNWIALNAEGPETDRAASETYFSDFLFSGKETELKLEDWMLSFGTANRVAGAEPELELEDWMLDFKLENHFVDASGEETDLDRRASDRFSNESLNLKPYPEEWIHLFGAWGYSDFCIKLLD